MKISEYGNDNASANEKAKVHKKDWARLRPNLEKKIRTNDHMIVIRFPRH